MADDGSKTPPEGRFEQRVWIVVYVAVFALLAAGAARRIWAMI